jgi:hypothetical protein
MGSWCARDRISRRLAVSGIDAHIIGQSHQACKRACQGIEVAIDEVPPANRILEERIARKKHFVMRFIEANTAERVSRCVEHFKLQRANSESVTIFEIGAGACRRNRKRNWERFFVWLGQSPFITGVDKNWGLCGALERIVISGVVEMTMRVEDVFNAKAPYMSFLQNERRRTI